MLRKSLFDLAHHELERACGLVRKAHPDPIDPQFRILCVDGHLRIAITLTENAKERARRLALVSDFMAWKMAPGFVLTSEIHEPDALLPPPAAFAFSPPCLFSRTGILCLPPRCLPRSMCSPRAG